MADRYRVSYAYCFDFIDRFSDMNEEYNKTELKFMDELKELFKKYDIKVRHYVCYDCCELESEKNNICINIDDFIEDG